MSVDVLPSASSHEASAEQPPDVHKRSLLKWLFDVVVIAEMLFQARGDVLLNLLFIHQTSSRSAQAPHYKTDPWRRYRRRNATLSEPWYTRKRPLVVLESYDVYRVVAIVVHGDFRIKHPPNILPKCSSAPLQNGSLASLSSPKCYFKRVLVSPQEAHGSFGIRFAHKTSTEPPPDVHQRSLLKRLLGVVVIADTLF
ncbi:hypothetical protein DFH06DRAFT_1337875 [Mycena polygramma]|nr:hypothetical protein DFH06DRAFT_1337875 [Mycena polygramma]